MHSGERQNLRNEKSCPLSAAHTRLRQAHDLWHSTVESYPFPDDFVRNLSNLVVTLRQVTFMLQTQKEKIADFDSWYESGWRPRLEADPLMAWLHDARTKIEHVGDLDLESTAAVSVISNWLDGPYAEFQVPPHVGPEEIATNFGAADLPDRVRREGMLRVERRWVSSDLPGQELTDVCAHGYGVLATILAEAHERLGVRMQTFGGESHEHRHKRQMQSGGRLPCMVVTRETRTAHLHLASGNIAEMERESSVLEFTPDEIEAFEKHSESMLVDPQTALSFTRDQDPIDVGRQVSNYACRVLAHDGYHWPTALFLDDENRLISITKMHFGDQAEKYLAFRALADDAERDGATTVIQIGEVWQAVINRDELSPEMRRASERADRTEALQVVVATADGKEGTFVTPFTRDRDDRLVLGATRRGRLSRQINASFLPLKQMWARRKRRDA